MARRMAGVRLNHLQDGWGRMLTTTMSVLDASTSSVQFAFWEDEVADAADLFFSAATNLA